MKVVVVTGASGSVGSRLIRSLVERVDVERVVALDQVKPALDHPKLSVTEVDLSALTRAEESAVVALAAGATAIIHLAWAAGDDDASSVEEQRALARSNVNAVKAALGLASRCGVAAFVHVSSATVYGAWSDNDVPLSEQSRILPNPELPFAVAKAEAERVIAEWSDANGAVSVAVLRPAVTVGSADRRLYGALDATGVPGFAPEGRLVQYLHVDDLATAVEFAWEQGLDGVFNVAPDAGIAEEEARRLAGGLAALDVPGRLGALLAALGWKVWRKGVPPEALAYATYPWVVSPDRLVGAGWRPAYSSAEAFVATDPRWHWDDLPPGKRQNLNSLLLLLVSSGLSATALGFLAWWRRRRRTVTAEAGLPR
ncbi:MAG: NAD-dependent epimerase/dehydratase family protein [Acidimicrobiales bacterium]